MSLDNSSLDNMWPVGAADWGVEQEPAVLTARLIQRCLNGEDAAYVLLYNQFAGPIYRLCYSLLQDQGDAEEVLQDSFEYAFRRLEQFDAAKSTFKTWLYRIAISRCRNKRRRKWLPTFSFSQLAGGDLPDTQAPTPAELLALDGLQRAVWQALGQLSAKLRVTAVLRYYENLSYNEISAILDIPAKTVESRMRLAHKALRELLRDEDPVGG
jgi:RNA polymerase sigma-70 factor, ECF subfamily